MAPKVQGLSLMNLLKFLGLFLFGSLTAWIMDMAAGIGAFIDATSFLYVIGGGACYGLIKFRRDQIISIALLNFRQGAIYSGWLAFLVGLSAILKNADLPEILPLISIAMIPLLYAYLLSWVILSWFKGDDSHD